jgi:SAM-dependent methyltransferase
MQLRELHPMDAQYFRSYASDARKAGRSLSSHYLHIQAASTGDVATGFEDFPGLSLAACNLDPGASILVVGCGAGMEVQWLVEHGFKRITGLDVDQNLLKAFEARLGLPTICADMRTTGLEDGSFDVVMAHRSIHHLFYPFQGLEELARIAASKICLANEPVRSPLKSLWRRLSSGRIISSAQIYEYQFDPEDVTRYMLFNGFDCTAFHRFWETGRLKRSTRRLLNHVAGGLGNRFSAVFRRIQT